MEQAAGGASSEEAERPDANLPPTDTESSSSFTHLHHIFHPHLPPPPFFGRSPVSHALSFVNFAIASDFQFAFIMVCGLSLLALQAST